MEQKWNKNGIRKTKAHFIFAAKIIVSFFLINFSDMKSIKEAYKAVMNAPVKKTGFKWGFIFTVFGFLPIVVAIVIMLYTESPISRKPYLLFVPSFAVTIFVMITRKNKYYNKDLEF